MRRSQRLIPLLQVSQSRGYFVGVAGELVELWPDVRIRSSRSVKLPGAGAGSIRAGGGAGITHVTCTGGRAQPDSANSERTVAQLLDFILVPSQNDRRGGLSLRLSRLGPLQAFGPLPALDLALERFLRRR